jgi:hypothetical protein
MEDILPTSAKSKLRPRPLNLQSAMEYLATYGWAFLIIAVAVSALYLFFSPPSSLVPSSCRFISGVYCRDLVAGSSLVGSGGSSGIQVLLTNSQQYMIINPQMQVNVSGTLSNMFSCLPANVLPGGAILCTVTLPQTINSGASLNGKLYFSAITCQSGNAILCASGQSQTYLGSFNTQVMPTVSNAFSTSITLAVQNANQVANGGGDQLTATVMLFGIPVSGATVTFSSPNSFVTIGTPGATTDSNGHALSSIASLTPGTATVTATFANVVASNTVTFTTSSYTVYTLTMVPGSGGTVSPSSGPYLYGSSVAITATPNGGYVFTGWTGSGTGSYYTGASNSANVVMNGNVVETASFAQAYSLTMNGAGAGGSVSPSSGNYLAGNTVAITATPSGGYVFTGWNGVGTGSYTGTSDPANIVMNGNIVETAGFGQFYFIPITLTNYQTSSTTSGFQQMLAIPSNSYSSYINSGWTNVEFTSGEPIGTSGNVPLYAWVESNAVNSATNTIVWVNLGSSTILSNSGTLTIYMNILPSNVMTSNTAYTGEAPQLYGGSYAQTSYGQYDNGAIVFSTLYDNFIGSNINTNTWTVYSGSANNGYTIPGSSSGGGLASKSTFNVQSYAIDFYMYFSGFTNANKQDAGWYLWTTQSNEQWIDDGYGTAGYSLMNYNGNPATTYISAAPTNAYSVFSVWCTSSSSYAQQNYGSTFSNSGDFTSLSSMEVAFEQIGSLAQYSYLQWVRLRVSPPGGVMPTASFNGVIAGPTTYSFSATAGANGAVTCAYSSNSVPIPSCSGNFLAGTQITLTAAPNPGYTAFWTGTGSGSYTGFANPINVIIYSPMTEAASFSQLYSVPITLTNSQTSPTASGFQQMLNIPSNAYSLYMNPGWTNVEFTSGEPIGTSGNVPLYAWVESNAVNTATNTLVWVNLGSSTIPANSGTLTIYMNFMPSSVMTSNTAYTGEAPQLSGTYGQYDNGALVFPSLYQNFVGTNTPSGWAVSGSHITINNGFTYSSSSDGSSLVTSGVYGLSSSQILDVYGETPSSTPSSSDSAEILGYSANLLSTAYIVGWQLDGNTGYEGDEVYTNGVGRLGGGDIPSYTGAFYVFSTYWASSSGATFWLNYGSQNTITYTTSSSQLPLGLALTNSYTGHSSGPYYWIRIRAYPPSGVMPSAVFSGAASLVPIYSFNSINSCPSPSVTMLTPNSETFCASDCSPGVSSVSWTTDTSGSWANIGHQTSSTCSLSDSSCTCALAGVSVFPSAYTLRTTGSSTSQTYSFSYNVIDSGQATFILISQVNWALSSVTPPSGCSTIVNQPANGYAYIAECSGQSPGAYTFSATASGGNSYPVYWAVYSVG